MRRLIDLSAIHEGKSASWLLENMFTIIGNCCARYQEVEPAMSLSKYLRHDVNYP